jgi:hypothetical protein
MLPPHISAGSLGPGVGGVGDANPLLPAGLGWFLLLPHRSS